MSGTVVEADVATVIRHLAGLDIAGLRERWRNAFEGEAPMRMSREVMGLALSHDLQVRTFGGPSPAALEWLRGGTGDLVSE